MMPLAAAPERGAWARFGAGIWHNKMASFGAGIVVLMVLSAVLAPWLSPHDPLEQDVMLRRQVAQMQALSREAAALSGKSASASAGNYAAPRIAMSKQNIEAALARNGFKPQSVILTGDFAKVQLAAVSFAGTLNWLDEMQKSALLSVVDANIVALSQPDMINATFTLRLPSHE